MRKLFFILVLCSTCLADSILVDGLKREYIIHTPPNFSVSQSLPLVLAIHGGGGDAKGMIKLTHFSDVADKYDFIVVYPDAVDKNWNDGRTDNEKLGNQDDVKFISLLIDTLISLYNIDKKKIYSTGISNGGLMSFRLGCELSDKITAIAPVASSMPLYQAYLCSPVRKIPVMIIFGKEDPLVPYEGGEITALFGIIKRGKVKPIEEVVSFWSEKNGVHDFKTHSELNEKFDGTSVFREVYGEGSSGEIQYWLIEGGGHTWPGGWQYLPKSLVGKTTKEFDASEEVWKFFSGKTL